MAGLHCVELLVTARVSSWDDVHKSGGCAIDGGGGADGAAVGTMYTIIITTTT